MKASSQHLKTGIARIRYDNPDGRFPGPPGWGLDRRADYHTSLKNKYSHETQSTVSEYGWIIWTRTGTSNDKMALKMTALYHECANHATEGETLQSTIHCCDVTNPPYLFSSELCTSTLHCKRLFVYTVCCRRGDQCFYVLRTRKSDVILT